MNIIGWMNYKVLCLSQVSVQRSIPMIPLKLPSKGPKPLSGPLCDSRMTETDSANRCPVQERESKVSSVQIDSEEIDIVEHTQIHKILLLNCGTKTADFAVTYV